MLTCLVKGESLIEEEYLDEVIAKDSNSAKGKANMLRTFDHDRSTVPQTIP